MSSETKHKIWIAVATILALGIIISSAILASGIKEIKDSGNTISVKGSAKKQITSDLVVWTGSYSSQSENLKDAYGEIKKVGSEVKKYLTDQGIDEKAIVFSSIETQTNYFLLPNGTYSSNIESYRLTQRVEVKSKEIEKVTEISRNSTDLINQGIEFQSYPPQYFYTKLADLKIDMIGLATKDAKTRATKILDNTGNKVGALKSANTGIFQITPLYSEEVSDFGVSDTSSIEKEITAVVNCEFEVK